MPFTNSTFYRYVHVKFVIIVKNTIINYNLCNCLQLHEINQLQLWHNLKKQNWLQILYLFIISYIILAQPCL